MTYTFKDISTTKFSINDREFYKTFIAHYISDSIIKIFNVYDSTTPLIQSTLVSDIDIDGTTYANATLLMNALTDVLYVREGTSGDLDSAQIEANRVAIVSLQSGKANTVHTHDDRYYTETEIDSMLSSIGGGISTVSGDIDGNNLNLTDQNDDPIGTIDVSELKSQATIITYEDYKLILKDASGNTLSSTSIIPALIDIDATYADGTNVDKTGKWVIGSRPGINGGDSFIGLSNAPDPTTDADIDEIQNSK